MLQQGRADLAAIDAHTVNQLGIELPLPIVGKSTDALAPPYVHHRNSSLSSEFLMQALACAVREKGSDIGITGIVKSDRADYGDNVLNTQKSAIKMPFE